MSLIPAMFQYMKKMVNVNKDRQIAFAPLATPFTNEDFLFMNSDIYKSDPMKYYAESLEFSQKANSIIDNPHIWKVESADFLYTRFDEILHGAKLIENRALTDAERNAQEKARSVLFGTGNTPTEAYKAYKLYAKQFNDIKSKLETHTNNKPTEPQNAVDKWNTTLKAYEKALQEKELEWNALGFRNTIESAMKTFDKPRENIERDIFVSKWNKAKNFMDIVKINSIVAGSEIFPMECIPNNLYQYKGATWTTVNLNRAEIEALTNELKQSVGNIDISMIFGDVPVELDKVSFEICRLVLSRSWFEEDLLLSRFWDYPEKVASGDRASFEGLIPAYPVELILVKNVDFTLAQNSAMNEQFINNLKTNTPISLGPFLVKSLPAKAALMQPLRVQMFTKAQLHVMNNTLSQGALDADKPASEMQTMQLRSRANIIERSFKASVTPPPIVRDHRTNLPPPIIRDHPPAPGPDYVWVEATPAVPGHWERRRAGTVETGKIVGKIVDANGQALAEVEITILATSSPVAHNDLTDSQGMFTIENVSRETYHLTIKKEGFSVLEQEIALSGNLDLGTIKMSSLNPVENFLLLGVVYKKLPSLPNPLPNEVYSR